MSVLVSRVLHAGYIFEHENTKIIFDPIFENPFSRNCFAFPKVSFEIEAVKKLKFSAIFISHYHDDHCSLESLDLLDRETPVYLYCHIEELFELIKEMGFTKVYSLEIDSVVNISSISVTPRLALDADVDTIFEIIAGDVKILNVVDAWIDPLTLDALAMKAPWDLVLWPFQTMLEIHVLSPKRIKKYVPEIPNEWIQQLKSLQPKNIVPSSCQFLQEDWSWYNQSMFPISYQYFSQEIQSELPTAKILRLDPGSSVNVSRNEVEIAANLKWIQKTDSETVDYKYQPPLVFPETAEIAKKFAELNSKQIETVLYYCQHQLVEILNSIGISTDPYFDKIRIWHLSLFNHLGAATNFYYKIENRKIEQIEAQDIKRSWTTKLPMRKLYQAISEGEALTSMYIRINDDIFDEQAEIELHSADLLSDPLIHALSYKSEISYQKAQLKKIKFSLNHKSESP